MVIWAEELGGDHRLPVAARQRAAKMFTGGEQCVTTVEKENVGIGLPDFF